MEAKNNSLRIGIVGLGGHGGSIQNSAQLSNRIEVVAVCDPNREVLDESVERFECDGYEDYNDMLARGGMGAVVLVTPNHLHRRQVEAAFDAGIQVMVEKPIANTVEDGVAMMEAARAHDRLLYVGHNMRFTRAFDQVKSYVDGGQLGKIITAEIHFSADNTRWMSKDAWRLQPELCPMMPVMQLGIHGIDVVQSFLGPIVSVSAYSDAFTTVPGVTDSVTAAVRFASGSMGTLVSNYCTQVAFDFRISGTEATVVSTPHKVWFRKAADTNSQCEGPKEEFDFLKFHAESFKRQMDAFAGMVLDGAPAEASNAATVADALRALAVVEALEESATLGRSVDVQQVSDSGDLL
ncbi:MAG: Gfo/Idh/MocA family protein [Rhodothermia bacterium]